MSTPTKQLKLEQAEDEVKGYVHFVSPVKTSNKNNSPYFQCVLQTGKDDYDEIISFSPERHTIFTQASEKKTPIRLSGISKTLSFRSQSGTSILCRRQTNIQSSICDFNHKVPTKNPLEKVAHDITLADMSNEVTGNYVTVTAQIIYKYEIRQVQTKSGTVDLCDAVLADGEGNTKITLWTEHIHKVQQGHTYTFDCLSVKEFNDEKYLSTCANTNIKETENMNEVENSENYTPTKVVGTPVNTKVVSYRACNQCHIKLDLSPAQLQKKSFKCLQCGMRSLLAALTPTVNAKIKLDSSTTCFDIPHSVLASSLGTIDKQHLLKDAEELEEFLLEKEVTLTLPTVHSCIPSAMDF